MPPPTLHVSCYPYGYIIGIEDGNGNPLTVADGAPRFAFTGQEYDDAAGLYFYGARYYDPTTGRFISEDPLGFAAGDANLYRYVGNNPVTFVDPTDGATGWPIT